MAIQQITGTRYYYEGLSTDTKPQSTGTGSSISRIPNGSTFYELDTGRTFRFQAISVPSNGVGTGTGDRGHWWYPTSDLGVDRTNQLTHEKLDNIADLLERLLEALQPAEVS